ncbi:hypothetical protein [Aquipseudomonas campi]
MPWLLTPLSSLPAHRSCSSLSLGNRRHFSSLGGAKARQAGPGLGRAA